MEHFFLGENRLKVYDGVYPPNDDSFLLAESVKVHHNAHVLDMGCGTGIQGIRALLKGAKKCLFVDVNNTAIANARENTELAGVHNRSEFLENDLFTAFETMQKKFDIITFNAPYVITREIKYPDTDGGKHGRKVLDRFLQEFPLHLKSKGACYFLQTSLNGIRHTEKILSSHKLHYQIIAVKNLFFEELLVFSAGKY